MNIVKLKEILVTNKLFVDEKSKNMICVCPYCGDHPDPRKKGHLWISKNPELPIGHCFFCNGAWPIAKIISDITGNKYAINDILTESERNQNTRKSNIPKHSKDRYKELKIPVIDSGFDLKRRYIQKRSNNLFQPEEVPNLIFDFEKFLSSNNLNIVGDDKQVSGKDLSILQQKFIGFLGQHHTILYCRNCDPNDGYKFKKISLQDDNYQLLDYYSINGGNPNSNTIVLSEGAFNIIGECGTDSLKIKDNVKVYASGNGFSLTSLIKSVCIDNSLYQCKVVFLSDNDKQKKDYRRMIVENEHIVEDLQIFYNLTGKDFGTFPLIPVRIL